MALFYFFRVVVLTALFAYAFGTIDSVGTQTADQIRSKLGDKAFKLSLKKAQTLKTKDWVARLPALSKTPAVVATDVQSLFADATVQPGKTFLRHYHPRSAELVYVTQGPLLVRFEFDGLSGRKVQNVIETGEFTVIPQGLIHDAVCQSKSECHFVAIFKTADPGLVALDPI